MRLIDSKIATSYRLASIEISRNKTNEEDYEGCWVVGCDLEEKLIDIE